MGIATIVGGGLVHTALDPRQQILAQQAFNNAGATYAWGKVWTDLNAQPLGGTYNVYNVDPASGQILHLPAGGQALVLEGSQNAQMVGHIGQELLIGNAGNDTINAAGGDGTIIAGGGRDMISLNSPYWPGGHQFIVTGAQQDTINMWGGSATIDGAAGDIVNLRGGANTVVDATANPLDVVVTGDSSDNTISLNGHSSVEVNVSGDDTIATGSSGGSAVFFNHTGEVDATIYGHAGDKVYLESGTNIVHAAGASLIVSGGVNQVTMFGGAQVTIGGGTNDFTAGGANNLFIEHGGMDTVRFAHGANDTLNAAGSSGGSVVLLGGADTLGVLGGANIITVDGTGNVLNLTGGGLDTVIGASTININDTANYTIVVHGNDTVDFGTGADTVIHGTATIQAGGGGVTVSGGSHAPAGQTSILGGSASQAMAAMAKPEGSLEAARSAAGARAMIGGQHGGVHDLGLVHGGAQVTLAAYDPAAAVPGAGATLTLDQGLTRITLGGLGHPDTAFGHH